MIWKSCFRILWVAVLAGALLAISGATMVPAKVVARSVPPYPAGALPRPRRVAALQETRALTDTLTLTSTLTLSQTPGSPTQAITATATYIPLPAITFQYPRITPTAVLLSVEREPGDGGPPKDSRTAVWKALAWGWPFLLLLLVWIGLAVWFLIAGLVIQRR